MTAGDIPALDLSDYDFELPATAVAQSAAAERDAARLLHLDRSTGELIAPDSDTRVRDLPDLLRAGDLLVLNATRVLPARLRGRRSSGGRAEALLLGPAPGVGGRPCYRALLRISGRPRVGLDFEFGRPGASVAAELLEIHSDGEVVLGFEPGVSPYSAGEAPLPPYIRRDSDGRTDAQSADDLERYQTVYARVPGAIAAPTAGLHVSPGLLERCAAAGIERAELVLHVGAGTFRPLREADLAGGRLHAEEYVLPEETVAAVERARARGGRIVAVGTTTTRVLESCAAGDGHLRAGSGRTDLFLRPGSRFRVVEGLLTNFHLPRSSLLLLVAAFAGREPVLRAYREALARGYRFYSYGDAMLII